MLIQHCWEYMYTTHLVLLVVELFSPTLGYVVDIVNESNSGFGKTLNFSSAAVSKVLSRCLCLHTQLGFSARIWNKFLSLNIVDI